jgi:DNA-binding transcriptional ArsR family regulator
MNGAELARNATLNLRGNEEKYFRRGGNRLIKKIDGGDDRKSHVPKIKCQAIGAASDFMKSLSNPVRLSILCILMEGARTVGELENILDVHQPTLSQQIGELREAGIITGERVAKAVVYRLADPRAGQIIGHLRLLFPDANASAVWRGAQFGINPLGEMS